MPEQVLLIYGSVVLAVVVELFSFAEKIKYKLAQRLAFLPTRLMATVVRCRVETQPLLPQTPLGRSAI